MDNRVRSNGCSEAQCHNLFGRRWSVGNYACVCVSTCTIINSIRPLLLSRTIASAIVLHLRRWQGQWRYVTAYTLLPQRNATQAFPVNRRAPMEQPSMRYEYFRPDVSREPRARGGSHKCMAPAVAASKESTYISIKKKSSLES